MRKIFLILPFIVIFYLSGYGQNAHVVFGNGALACPEPINWILPDNSYCIVYQKGDMIINWFESSDGHMVIKNEQGFFEYAILNTNGDAIPSGVRYNDVNKRNAIEKAFVNNLPGNIFYSTAQVKKLQKNSHLNQNSKNVLIGGFPSTGVRKMLLILAKFSDSSPTYTQTQFDNLMNQAGYNGTGSFKDYYYEVSYGKLTINTTVTAWVTTPNTRSYYASNKAQFVRDAVNAADAAGIDFSQFDNDGDGYVDGVAVIHTGQGQEVSGNTLDIWSHNWSLSSAGYTVVKDGKTVNSYTCQPEKYTSSTMVNIGVICHEVGHNLGLPDFYDTDYETGGSYTGTGKWDIMAGGSYNNNGKTPSHPNAWSKSYLGWLTPVVLTDPVTVTMQNIEQNQQVYRINTTTTNEYFIMENKQKVGFDAYIPSSGLIIYHKHKDMSLSAVNATHPQKFYPIVASNTTDEKQSGSYGTINGTGCPFPGSASKTSFTDATTPNMKSWAGSNTSGPITEITHNTTAKTITFKFKGGSSVGTPVANFSATPTSGAAPLAVVFTNSSTGSPTSYSWNFGDGSTSTAQNPSHTYAADGIYTVALTVTNAAGSNTMTKTNYITVSSVPVPPNDECSGAITLLHEPTCNPVTGTTAGATSSLSAITCNNYTGDADDDVWYKFVATSSTATIFADGESEFDVVLDLRSGSCNGANINCADATGNGGSETINATGLTVGSTYYIRIYHYDPGCSTTPTFTICVSGGAAPTTPVAGISINPTSLNLTAGGATSQLTATIQPSNATNQNKTWTSSNNNVATVSQSGVVTPLAAGSCIISVTSQDGNYAASCSVNVSAAVVSVSSIVVSPSSLVLTLGGTPGQLNVSLSPSNATNQNVTWSSGNASIASVSSNGLVTAVSTGTCIIAVTSQDGNYTTFCNVTVNSGTVAVTGITLNPTSLNLTAGGATSQLTASIQPAYATNQNITWNSSNSMIASVSVNGLITPISEGSCIIAATTQEGNYTAFCNVTVNTFVVSVTGIYLTPSSLVLSPGDAPVQLSATILPSNATNQNIIWSSSNSIIASVSSIGIVTPISPGNCTVTATTQDGNYTATCNITTITTGLTQQDNYSFIKMYPNPTTDFVFIESSEAGKIDYRLINALGQEVKAASEVIGDRIYYLNLCNISNGIYFMEVIQNNHKSVQKLLIDR